MSRGQMSRVDGFDFFFNGCNMLLDGMVNFWEPGSWRFGDMIAGPGRFPPGKTFWSFFRPFCLGMTTGGASNDG